MTNVAQIEPQQPASIELHSIDWIPHSERNGKLADLGAVWFVGNINLTAMATGIAALSVGAGLMWTIIATIIGSLVGTFFMAFHSAQGPQLGLPQLVQSRPQFGYLGSAVTVWGFALINYVAYNTSDALLSGDAINTLFGIPTTWGYLIAAAVAFFIALYGCHWIHKINRWLAWPLLIVMAALTVAALADKNLPTTAFALGEFKPSAFATVFVIVAGFQLGWAPYVSDYSRYLPKNTSVSSTFWWTFLPSAISAIWVFVLGAVMFAAADPASTPVAAFKGAADRLVDGFGWLAIAALLIGLLSVMAINQYGGMMSMISIYDSFKPIKPTRRLRVITLTIMFFMVWGISHTVGIDRFNVFYSNILIFLTYMFTPWTAINLVDYFIVRKGHYSIKEIFNPNGIYGRWGWRGNTAYVVTILVMIPFMVTAPFTGFIAQQLGGVDYSMFVGLPLAGILYAVFCRSLDLQAELRIIQAESLGGQYLKL